MHLAHTIIISIPAFVYSTTSRLSLLTDNDYGTLSDFQAWEMLSTEPIPEELSMFAGHSLPCLCL